MHCHRPWPFGPLALQGLLQPAFYRQQLLGAHLPQAWALWPYKACCSPLCAVKGFWRHSCHRPWPFGPVRLVTALFLQASALGAHLPQALGAFLPQVLALLPCKACRSPLRAASGFLGATFPHPLLAGGAGALGHCCHIPCPHGPARLATALSVQAGALGILVTGLCPLAPQGLLQPSMASQGLLQTSHSCHNA